MVRPRTHRARRVLGITGPIGCGKTAVGNILLTLGATERIDADSVVHELMLPGTTTTASIARAFGSNVLREDGAVDRGRLAAVVFADQLALRTLEQIVHPGVRSVIRTRLDTPAKEGGTVIVDAVKLLESDLLAMVDEVWLVQCGPEEQLRRLTAMRGMSEADAEARIAAQPAFEHPAVTRVIENNASMADLEERVRLAWQMFLTES